MALFQTARGGTLLLYKSNAPITLSSPSKKFELEAVHDARRALQAKGCQRITLLLSGVRALDVSATGVKVFIEGRRVGAFSLYGLESGVHRNISFSVPLTVFSVASPRESLTLAMEMVGKTVGVVVVESAKVWCE